MDKVLFSSQSNEWSTPQSFYNELNKEFNFNLDPCSTNENNKCENHFTIDDDGLKQDWQGHIVFCNPPYGRVLKEWVQKCYEESLKPNTKVVMLIPARTDTIYFHKYIYNIATIRFLKGRLKFGECKNSAPFPSMVVVF